MARALRSRVLLLTLVVLGGVRAGWSPNRLRHVDTLGQAHLFRGSSPVKGGTFVFDDLRGTMQAAAANKSIVVPDRFVLTVISMLNKAKSSEGAELRVEEQYFAHPSNDTLSGSQLLHWPIIGDVSSPSIYPKSLCHHHAKEYPNEGDRLPDKIAQIRSLLTNATQPSVVYFHCDAGVDRTGELYGDYMMQYHNQTYDDVYKYDNSVEPREINTVNKQALEWFCLWLYFEKKIDCKPNHCK